MEQIIEVELEYQEQEIEIEQEPIILGGSGTKVITENGVKNIKAYEFVDVQVPLPHGSVNITENGIVDVEAYKTANVNVPLPSDTINISTNGTHNVSEYGTAIVDVPDSIDALLSGETSVIRSNVTTLGYRTFQSNAWVTEIYLPELLNYTTNTNAEWRPFSSCARLTTLSIPKVKTLNNYSVAYTSALSSVDFSSVEIIGSYALAMNFDGAQNVLTQVELPNIKRINTGAFQHRSNLVAVILGRGTRATLGGTDAFHKNTIIYAYQDDIDEWYSTATNWSALYQAGRIVAIEGSEYE